MNDSPLSEYHARLAAREASLTRVAGLDARISFARLAVVGLVVLTLAFAIRGNLVPWLILLPLATFAALAAWHDRVLRDRRQLSAAVAFYERGIARIEDRWHGTGEPGERFLDPQHLYAADLDLFGPGSLFQLLSRARTQLGEEMIAAWLKTHAEIPTIRLRQSAVEELRRLPDFRESLFTQGGMSRDVDTVSLAAWASMPLLLPALWLRVCAVLLSAAIIAGAAWWLAGGPLTPLVAAILLKTVLTRPLKHNVARVVRGVEGPLRQLGVLSQMLRLIEQQAFASPRLHALRQSLGSESVVPSEAIRNLKRLADMLDWRRNAFFAPISAALSWPLHIAAAIEQWRAEFGPKVAVWLSTIAEYETLSSLACYAYEHPEDPFPVLLENGPSRFDGTALGHPVVPRARMITNDVRLSPEVRLMVVSGSNMSGKSTLLRTVGVNVVLAMSGAPVRASRLELTPLAVGATLRIHDSLQEGRSRFFAEISRIREIIDLTGREPAPLFLLDELFQGTNSHDRKIGADALLENLISRGAIGLTTTHDLALTEIAARPGSRAANVHFEDRLEGDQMVFDYKMRAGPVTHSNALALMKAVGLPVSPAS